MSIQDFKDETKRRAARRGRDMTSGEKEVHSLSFKVYCDLNKGGTREWVRKAGEMLVKSIAPNLSYPEAREAVISIEGIALTVLMKFFLSGTLIKKEVDKDETRE